MAGEVYVLSSVLLFRDDNRFVPSTRERVIFVSVGSCFVLISIINQARHWVQRITPSFTACFQSIGLPANIDGSFARLADFSMLPGRPVGPCRPQIERLNKAETTLTDVDGKVRRPSCFIKSCLMCFQ